MTSKDTARAVKADIDRALLEIVEKYKDEFTRYATIRNTVMTEWVYAFYELQTFGKILDNAERWHSEKRALTEQVYECHIKGDPKE